MSQTTTTADAVLKDFYLPGIRNVLNNETFLLSQIEANEEDVEGRAAVLGINTTRNQGIGARAESGTLPTAGRQGYVEQRVPLKYNYGRLQISGPLIKAMASDRGSFNRAVDSETKGLVRDLRNDYNRQLYGYGNGRIALVGADTTTNDLTLVAADANPVVYRQLQVGMYIDVGTAADPTATASNRQITAVNTTTGVITVDGAELATVTANDVITRAGSGGQTSAQKEITGLRAAIAETGTYLGITLAEAPNWASYVDDNSGTDRAVAEAMFTRAQQEVNVASGEEIDLWVTDMGVHRAVAALITTTKRFVNSVEMKGGYSALDMSSVSQGNQGGNTVGLYWDKDCPFGEAYGLCTKRIQHYRMSDWEFMDDDGAILNRVANTDAYEATLYIYSELATDARNAHAAIRDLTSA
jgi:hypothetical protein